MREALVVLATAAIAVAAQLAREWVDRRRRLAGQLRTREGDRNGHESAPEVWVLESDQGDDLGPRNGRGDTP